MEPDRPSGNPPPAPWPRYPQRPQIPAELLGAAIAGVVAVVLGLVGLILMTTTDFSFESSASKFHGGVLVPLPLLAASTCAAAALALGIVGVVKAYGEGISVVDAGGAWAPYSHVWALVAAALMVVARPLNAAFARAVAAPLAGLAFIFGIIGLAVGLGDDERDPTRGLGWIGFGVLFAFLTLAVWLGARSTAAGERAAGP